MTDWNAYAKSYDAMAEENPAYTAIIDLLVEFGESLQRGSGERLRVLDVGAGTGNFSAAWAEVFPQDEITLVEPSAAMLERARAKLVGEARAMFLDSAFMEAELEAGSFDVVICVHALYCMAEPAVALAKLRRCLKPGGAFFLCDVGRPLKLWSWRLYLIAKMVVAGGPRYAARQVAAHSKNLAAANGEIRAAQLDGAYWTHTTEEFVAALARCGFEAERSGKAYRGYSSFAFCGREKAQ